VSSDGPQKGLSADIRVGSPANLIVELKARSIHGTNDALGSEKIVEDLKRVGSGMVDMFVLAADRELYDGLRGFRKDPRGRKPKHTEIFYHTLPDSATFAARFPMAPVKALEVRLEVLGARVVSIGQTERVIVGVWRGALAFSTT